jgi:hypothetical protein
MIVPTGVGQTEEVKVEAIEQFMSARFLPGGEELIIIGARAGETARPWLVSAKGGTPVAITNDEVASWFSFDVSPDGEWIATITSSQKPRLYPVRGGAPREVPGAEVGDFPVHWPHADELMVCRREEQRALIFAIDLRSGARRLVRTLTPPDAAGVQGVYPVHFAADGQTYVFGYRIILSSLFLVTGIR